MYYAYYKVKLHRYYGGILTCYLSLHALDQPNKLQLLHESVYLHAYWWWEPWGGQKFFSQFSKPEVLEWLSGVFHVFE